MLWTFHHALLDGRSHLSVIKDLFRCYEALRRNGNCSLAETTSFATFARWVAERDHAESHSFWLEHLEGVEAATRPAVARPGVRPHADEEDRATVEACLTEEETQRLRTFAATHGLTLGTLVHAAWAAMLGRYSGSEDVVLGATRACRYSSVPGSESAVGLLINTVPFRIRIAGEAPVLEWLKDLRTRWIAMRPHEFTPLRTIQNWCGFGPDSPLFDTLLVYEDHRKSELLEAEGGVWKNRKFRTHEHGDYPLVALGYGGTNLLLRIAYGRGDFNDETVRRMLTHWRTLLLGLATNPQIRVADLPMLSPEELQTLLRDWNATGKDYETEPCLHRLVEAQAARTPEHHAVLFEAERLNYAELNARANRLAHYLCAAGVGPEVRVALCLERSPELIVAILGILKAGGAYVPLEPDQPQARLDELLAGSRASLLVTQEDQVGKFSSPGVSVVLVDRDRAAIGRCSDANPESGVASANLAYGLYTSGSTGAPKLIGVEHRNVVNLLRYTTEKVYAPADLAMVPFADTVSFDPSVYRMFSVLATGGSLVLLQSHLDLPRSRWAGSITLLGGAPSVMRALLIDFSLPPTVQVASFGAEVPGESLLEQLQQYSQLDRIHNFYGPTETTIYCTHATLAERARHVSPRRDAPVAGLAKPTVIGRPIWNVQAYILDARLRPVPIGVSGEICIGGACVARGCLEQPELTAEKFIPDPFSSDPAARLYKTGDLGRFLPDGNIEFLGRMDNQVKIRGVRVEPQGIAAMLDAHPGIEESLVVPVRDPADVLHLVAYVVPRLQNDHPEHAAAPETVDGSSLRSFLESRLPRWSIPEEFVLIDALPRTIRGKIDTQALPQAHFAQGGKRRSHAPARTAEETALARIWQEVLGVPQVGIHDSGSTPFPRTVESRVIASA